MSDPFVAEVRIFFGEFAPQNWAFCDGQLIPIIQNTTLFSLVGIKYGGDGKSTFALPDLRNRVPVGVKGSSKTPSAPAAPVGYLLVNFIIALYGVFPPHP